MSLGTRETVDQRVDILAKVEFPAGDEQQCVVGDSPFSPRFAPNLRAIEAFGLRIIGSEWKQLHLRSIDPVNLVQKIAAYRQRRQETLHDRRYTAHDGAIEQPVQQVTRHEAAGAVDIVGVTVGIDRGRVPKHIAPDGQEIPELHIMDEDDVGLELFEQLFHALISTNLGLKPFRHP